MKQGTFLILSVAATITLVSGCMREERLKTYEVSEVSNNRVENKFVEEYVGPDGKKVVNKEMTTEKVQCVDKDGRPLRGAKNTIDCLKRKGKVVDQVYQEQRVTRSR